MDRLRVIFAVVAILAFVSIIVRNEVENNAQNTRIARIESPCLRYGPHSKKCRESFAETLRALTPTEACWIAELARDRSLFCHRLARQHPRLRVTSTLTAPGARQVPPSPLAPSRPPRHHHASAPAPVAPAPALPPAPPSHGHAHEHGGKVAVELEVPTLPAHACAPGVVNVNC